MAGGDIIDLCLRRGNGWLSLIWLLTTGSQQKTDRIVPAGRHYDAFGLRIVEDS